MLWQRLDRQGAEYCRLTPTDSGWEFDGTSLLQRGGRPTQLRYAIRCDESWCARWVELTRHDGAGVKRLELSVDRAGSWWSGGRRWAEFDRCRDVDFGFSPATNTQAIRRLDLEPGETGSLTAIWVRFPQLELQRVEQSYRRLDAHRYRYQSHGGDFSAELVTDADGLVESFPRRWEVVASS